MEMYRREKSLKLNEENREDNLENNKIKKNNFFNRNILSNLIRDNMKNNRENDELEIQRSTEKLYSVDSQAYNTNRKVILL